MAVALAQQQDLCTDTVIPVIDLGPYLSGMAGALEATAAQLRVALESIGFFIIIHHNVPQELIARAFAAAKRFHDQPLAAKMALRMNEHNNGYMALGKYAVWTSDVQVNDKPDLNEAFFIKRERQPDDPLARSGRRFVGPNLWPAHLPGWCDTVLAYTDAVDALGRRLMPDYPPLQAEENQFGIAPHTDANFLTFLAQTEVPGLQVRLPSGAWLDVPYIPGSFAVNSGDMMYRWTNGRFKSTPHRALPPVGQHRYAIPFFMGPHLDTVIACLPTCQGPDNPPCFPPITYEKYLLWWYDANYNAALQNDPS